MTALPTLEISELSPTIQNCRSIGFDFMAGEVSSHSTISDKPLRVNAFCMLLTVEGSVSVSIDFTFYQTVPNSLINVTFDHVVQLFHTSSDFKGRLLVFSKDLIERLRGEFSASSYLHMKMHPYLKLEAFEMLVLNEYYDLFRRKVVLNTSFKSEIILSLFSAMFFELSETFERSYSLIQSTLGRKEQILESFLNLLAESYKVEHQVTFYAQELCITPQYLSATLNRLSGKTTRQWIDSFLVYEAKTMLRFPGVTVQEVAVTLHFPDQSTFGKFFKRQTGLSPLTYRRTTLTLT